MNSVESILSISEDNAKVILADGKVLVLPKKLIYDYQLRKNDTVSDETVEFLLHASGVLKSYAHGLRYLARRLHSSFELKQKLAAKGYDKEFIREALLKLENDGFLDDHRFAEQYTAELYFHRNEGIKKIGLMLSKKGIPREIAAEVIGRIVTVDESIEHGVTLAGKKYNTLVRRNIPPEKILTKVQAFLLSKGYSFSTIKTIMNELAIPREEAGKNSDEEDYS